VDGSAPVLAADVIGLRPPYDPRTASAGVYQGSRPAHSILNRPQDGYVGMDARSGIVEGGADGRVDAYSGFAYAFRPNTNGPYTAGFQIEGCHFSYVMESRGIGGSATAEGGLLVVVLEPPSYAIVAAARVQLWRRRVSGNESGHDSQNRPRLQVLTRSFGLTAGRTYFMSAVMYSTSDRSSGAGVAGSQSLGEGNINSIAVFTNP
jgi:hypothetical protein